MIRALVLLAEGSEEMEAVIPMDLFRRAKWEVVAAGLQPGPVTAARRTKLVPDAALDDIWTDEFDVLVVPGGANGVKHMRADPRVPKLARQFHDAGKFVGAICAGPLVLLDAGILKGQRITCYPAEKAAFAGVVQWVDAAVVVDGKVITGQGAGSAFPFALKIIEHLAGRAQADEIAQAIIWRG